MDLEVLSNVSSDAILLDLQPRSGLKRGKHKLQSQDCLVNELGLVKIVKCTAVVITPLFWL